jgi:hypothetical protein
MKIFNKTKRIGILTLITLVSLFILVTGLAAADNIVESYSADQSVLPGMVVALKSSNSNEVVPLNSTNLSQLSGVVVPVNQGSIVISPSNPKNQQVLVAHGGRYNVLVCDQNGPIKVGDYVSISAIDGIAMKADTGQRQVVGQAASSFSGTGSQVIQKEQETDSNGKKNNVDLGSIAVDVRLAPNPLYQTNVSGIPHFISKLADTLASKPVSPIKMYLSIVILIFAFLLAAIMMYSGIHSGIYAIGRNPLAKSAIGRGITKSTIAGIAVLVIGLLASYLIVARS